MADLTHRSFVWGPISPEPLRISA